MVSPQKEKFPNSLSLSNKRGETSTRRSSAQKPWCGQKFYVHVPANHSQSNRISECIRSLGGVTEEFLSKEVSFVVTSTTHRLGSAFSTSNSPSDSTSPTTNSPLPYSPSTTLSPILSPNNSGQAPSPADSKRRVTSRAASLLERARFKHPGSSDVLSTAKKWNIQALSIEQFQEKYNCDKGVFSRSQVPTNLRQSRQTTPGDLPIKRKPNDSTPASLAKRKQTGKSFIKVEDFSRKFKPSLRDLGEWPKLSVDTDQRVCPFAEPVVVKKTESRDTPKVQTPKQTREENKENNTPHNIIKKPQTPVASRRNSGGYCELCCENYKNLQSHLISNSHQNYITDSKNYSALDDFIRLISDDSTTAVE